MFYYYSFGCGIDLGDKFVVTGGIENNWCLQRVAQFSLTGEVTYLADLKERRCNHACTSFKDDNEVTVSFFVNNIKHLIINMMQTLLVTGGIFGSSTEIYRHSAWSYAASLPSPRSYFSAATVDNSVFVFGKFFQNRH